MKNMSVIIISLILSLFAVSSCSTTESSNIKTSGIWAHYVIDEYSDGETIAWGVLRVGGATGTIIDLVGGEYLECNGTRMTEYVEPLTNFHWNRAALTQAQDGVYDFTLIRTDEEITSTITGADFPTIDTTTLPDHVYGGEPLEVNWDATNPGEDVSVNVTGTCIQNIYTDNVADTGSYTVPQIFENTSNVTDCTITVKVLRHVRGDVSTLFQGGLIEANAIDEADLPLSPGID